MAGGKETPRQKMIGMMYLVLTALLALNVSKEILNAFAIINTGLESTNMNFAAKNEVTMMDFQKAMMNDEKKVKPFFDKAQSAVSASKEMFEYIKEIKSNVIQQSQQVEKNVADTLSIEWMAKKDEYDATTNYMIGSDPGNITGESKTLKARLGDYKNKLLALLDDKDRATMQLSGLNTDDMFSVVEEKVVSWEQNNFYHIPVAAVIAILSRIQNEVKNAEADVLKALYNRIDVGSFKFDTLAARVVANSNYVLTGDQYSAEIFVAAFSTTSNPTVLLGEIDTTLFAPKPGVVYDSTTVVVDRGVGVYQRKDFSEGENKFSGLIRVKNPADNTFKYYPFKSTFIGARPAAVVSPTKMNVLYIGVENPISVSVPGVHPDKVRATISNGSLSASGGKGNFVARVQSGNKAIVSVSADFNGSMKPMGTFEFRVKQVPDPVAFFAGKKASAAVNKSDLLAAQGVIANMENFDFDLKFIVLSFELSMTVGGVEATAKSNGNMVSAEQKMILSKSKSGSKVYIDQVKVKGPDGSIRTIPGLALKVI